MAIEAFESARRLLSCATPMHAVLEPRDGSSRNVTASTLPAIVSDSAQYRLPHSTTGRSRIWAERRSRGRFEAGAQWKRYRRGGVIEILRVIDGENGMTFVARGLETGITRRLAYGTLVREYRPHQR
jgi:hypothetical protein